MKYLVLLLLITIPISANSQVKQVNKKPTDTSKVEYKNDYSYMLKTIRRDNKIAFVVGLGGSYIFNNLYQHPTVSPTSKFVTLQKAQQIKSNISFGIAYTGRTAKLRDSTRVPYGITFATFVNPIALNQLNNDGEFFSILDFGIGIGHKFLGGLTILGTIDFFSVRQPRDWFIDEYENNDRSFIVDNQTQLAFDKQDSNIFYNKMAITFGFKIAYSFDIIKNYKNNGSIDLISKPK